MHSALANIKARTCQQAMDWSLALASQGIEAAIQHFPDAGGWVLQVEPGDYERAVATIRQYRLENRRWGWRQELPWSGLVFHWGALLWCWAIVLIYALEGALGAGLDPSGVLDSRAVGRGEWWRLFTAVCLHADLAHLAANASTGLLLLGLAMARYGAGCALLGSYLAGAAGNALGFGLRSEPYTGLGASGMVMGALGLLAVSAVALARRRRPPWRTIGSGLAGGVCLFILMGLNPASDVLAHAGGFAAGLLLGAGLAWMPPSWIEPGRWPGRTAMALTFALLACVWTLALS